MEYVYAALLLHKLKQDINEDNVKNVIKATGVNPDDVKVKSLVAAISEVNIEDALKAAPIAAAPAAAAAASPSSSNAGAAADQAAIWSYHGDRPEAGHLDVADRAR